MATNMSKEKVNAKIVSDDSNSDNINETKEKLLVKMKRAVTTVEDAPGHNQESFINLSQHFDNFLSFLKYLPVGTSFKDLPTEIKTQILNDLCDNGAFIAASVSSEWKAILREKIVNMGNVRIGRHCKNWRKDKCFNPTEVLKASLTLDLNIPLLICHDVQEVDSQLLAKALTNVTKFTLDDTCNCCEGVEHILALKDKALLTNRQGEELMKALETKSEPMEKVVLKGVDLTYLKDRLISCLLKKVKTLTLSQDRHGFKGLNFSSFVRKLRQNSAGHKLERLNLYFEYNGRLSAELLADGLSTVNAVDLGQQFKMTNDLAKRLISKMITEVATKTLIIRQTVHWAAVMSAVELESILLKMNRVHLVGIFTPGQVEVVGNLPDCHAMQRKGRICSVWKN